MFVGLYTVWKLKIRYKCHCQHELCRSPLEVFSPPWLWVTNYLNCFQIILQGNLCSQIFALHEFTGFCYEHHYLSQIFYVFIVASGW
jgi:hypothetical protein